MKFSFIKTNGAYQSPMSLFAALVLAALVPAICVLWFMSVAMRNERLAVQERLTAVYSNHLASLQPRVTAWAKERQAALQAVEGKTPSKIFAAVVHAGLADGVVVHDAVGKLLYPVATNVEPATTENTELARALLAQAAELLQVGQKDPALAKLAELTGNTNLRRVAGAQGVLIVPHTQLLILKTIGWSRGAPAPRQARSPELVERAAVSEVNAAHSTSSGQAGAPRPQQVLDDLVARLNDYSDTDLPSSQRRFLMREVKALVAEAATFPTLDAEELTADYLEHEPAPPTDSKPASAGKLQRTPLAKVWRLPSADRTIVALFREDRLRAELAAAVRTPALSDARVTVHAPDEAAAADKRIPSIDASELLPGWRLALGFNGSDPLALASARQSRFYLWSGFLVVLIIAVVAVTVARYVSAQMRLARLKDELVSTVSHELKTPLAAMRALLDTVLAGRYRDAAQMRRYLQLAAKENLRLSHLIENFLVFSRLARGQQQLRFTVLAPEEIVRTALDALGEKLTAPPCRLTTQLAPGLPAIRGDADALSTVLVNLLDNACKYTNGEKHIEVRAYAEGEQVVVAVADNGIGIAPDEQERIFDRFYQIDQSLTRQRGGCGLGLSIVQSIVRAHGGEVEVKSELGRGSTFRVKIPILKKEISSQRTQNAEREHRAEGIAP
ncbi:MAG: HAMP domain-containing sensor histidine kinase [Opitutaceae bacterium]|nr:HAMP domain-containing sensor histidine kinase [Opitutaceae bacterium]